jgi:hypothetical protein
MASEKDTSQHLASTSPTYISFGHGKSACPGRFYASAQLKVRYSEQSSPNVSNSWQQTLFAHVLTTFDVRTEVEGVRPTNELVGITNFPGKAKILFRKRM